MANQSKAVAAAALRAAGIARKSFSIPELCARHNISEGHYRNMKKRGKGAQETDFDGRTLVTEEHEAEWLRMLAAESKKESATT